VRWAGFLVVVLAASADDRAEFRARVYKPELPGDARPDGESIRFTYGILLVDESSARPMPPEHVFAKGEMFRIEVASGIDGYLAILQSGGSPRAPVVYPEAGDDGRIKAGERRQVPNTAFRVVDSPTHVTIVLSRQPLQLPAAPADVPRFREMLKQRARDVRAEEITLKQK
jgi:hypothetical protein